MNPLKNLPVSPNDQKPQTLDSHDEGLFRGLLESAPDGIVIVNQFGQIVLVNTQAEKMFGFSRKELHLQTVETLVPQRFHEAHPAHRGHYNDNPRVRPMGAGLELFGQRKDGSEFPVEISLSPVMTKDGPLVIAAIRDVTDRKRIEQALREKNVELENANLAKDRFLASMSHELRTPLNAIIGFTGTLIMKLPGPLTAEQEKQLRTIQASARHLLSLINDLLDLAKIESGKVELTFEPVIVQNVLAEVGNTLKPMAEIKKLTFDLTLPEDDILIQTDRRALSQIVINLTNNAIKFTESGGIQMRLSQGAAPDGTPLTVNISISDSGPGIRAEDQARLFKAFEQMQISRQRPTEGTGLGLYLSQKLAVLLGGRISFTSQVGQGSTFTFTLPANSERNSNGAHPLD